MRTFSSSLLVLATVAVFGCDGDRGARGEPGPQGEKGNPGVDGENAGGAPSTGTGGSASTTPTAVPLSPRAAQGFAISPVALDLEGLSPEAIEGVGMGSYWVNAIGGCNDCHAKNNPDGSTEFLGGGAPFALGPPIGTAVYARNLTPDEDTGMQLSEAEFIESMRTGKDFSADEPAQLIVMPWYNLRYLSDDDLRAIYAYFRAVPAVDNAVPEDIKISIPPLDAPASYTDGDVERPLPPSDLPDPNNVLRGLAVQPLATPPGLSGEAADVQAQYARGSYLVNVVGGCNDCHGNPSRSFFPGASYLKINTAAYLGGGTLFDLGVPEGGAGYLRSMSANLAGETYGMSYDFPTFVSHLALGKHVEDANGLSVAPPMPSFYGDLLIDDLVAIYTYLRLVPRGTGERDKPTQRAARACTSPSDCLVGETCAQGECLGACLTDQDCGACQTCSGTCQAPAPDSACLTSGL